MYTETIYQVISDKDEKPWMMLRRLKSSPNTIERFNSIKPLNQLSLEKSKDIMIRAAQEKNPAFHLCVFIHWMFGLLNNSLLSEWNWTVRATLPRATSGRINMATEYKRRQPHATKVTYAAKPKHKRNNLIMRVNPVYTGAGVCGASEEEFTYWHGQF